MRTSDFNYDLPPEYIAQKPIEPRDSAKLMILDRKNGTIQHSGFSRLGDYLKSGDVLVINNTKVFPARIFAYKVKTGGRVELLLLHKVSDDTWEALVGGKGLEIGRRIVVENGPEAEIISELGGSRRWVRFDQPVEEFLEVAGHVPLPPYIHEPLSNPNRYQTVYADIIGSAAAPTAGLHFTHELINRLEHIGIKMITVSLHIGLDTFAPVKERNPKNHQIHSEWYNLSEDAARIINQAHEDGNRIVAVGTTSVRVLESSTVHAKSQECVAPGQGYTDLFILPGYKYKVVDALITNFHLPRSTLIMLVSAFAGRDLIFKAYEIAKNEGYRFYSFGDAMLIL